MYTRHYNRTPNTANTGTKANAYTYTDSYTHTKPHTCPYTNAGM